MLNCETCRSQMLEYLYDLLESDERQAFEAHLKDCPACQAELVRSKGQQQLMAAAAKMEFAGVRFSAPDATLPLRQQEPASLPLRSGGRLRWRRWAVAAAVLLTLGVAGTAGWYGRDYYHTEQIVAQAEDQIQQAQRDNDLARIRLEALPVGKALRIADIHKTQREAQLQVKVQGPAALRVGAPTDYRIYTNDLAGQPTTAKVLGQVKDNGQTVGKPIEAAAVAPGVYNLSLPVDLPIRPASHPTLVVSAARDNGAQVELREEMQLAAPVYVTHLEIDKPIYQLGETVYFRSLTLDRVSLKPAQEDLQLQFVLTMPGPGSPQQVVAQGKSSLYDEGANGQQPLLGPDRKPLRGLGAGSFPIDPSWPGGEYSLIVRELNQRFPEQRRKFLINKYEKPKLNKELDFSRKSYGAGDEVVARCKAKFLDGRPVKNCAVHVSVNVDSRQYGRNGEESREAFALQTDEDGIVNVRFKLPLVMERGLGVVAVRFEDRAMPDTIVRPIPIVLNKLDIEFYPEGGDLISGWKNRVYFQVRSTLGKPADLKGRLLEDGKPLDITVETLASEKTPELNQGMGRFEFTPRAGHTYSLQVQSPIGVTKLHDLPKLKAYGTLLSLPQGVVKADQDIPVTVRSTTKRTLMIGVYCRGRLLDSTEINPIDSAGNEVHAVLHPASGVGGVCRVTVFEILPGDGARRTLLPVAERLIYRQPAERVQLALRPDEKSYVPRQTVKLSVEATTEKDEPAPAVVMLRVVDKSVLTLADDKTLRAMPTHYLLTTEVRRPEDLEFADFLLGSHPQAAEALDLLLGTQGWRRFAEQDPNKFRNEQKEEAERLLVTIGQSQPRITDLTQQELQRVESEYKRQGEELTAQAERAKKAEQEAREDRDYRAALVKRSTYEDFFARARFVGVPVLSALLVLAALACLILGVFRRLARAVPYYATAIGCAAAVLLLMQTSWQAIPPVHVGERQVAEVAAPGSKGEMTPARPPMERALDAAGAEGLELEKKAEKQDGAVRRAPGMGNGAGPEGAIMLQPMMKPAAMKPGFAQPAQGVGAAEGKDQFGGGMMGMAGMNGGMGGMRGGMMGMAGGGMAPMAQPPVAGNAKAAAGGHANMRMRQMMDRRREIDRGEMLAGNKRALFLPPMPVRVFAHPRASGPAEVRYDFAETLYWHPALVLPGGKTELSFDLCDSLGSFEVMAFAHTLDGRLGSAKQTITSQLPFTVQPRTPLEVSAGDKIDIPLAIANNTRQTRDAQIAVESINLSLRGDAPSAKVSVPADTTIRKLYRFQPTTQEGTATLAFTGKTDGFPADSIRTTFNIVPEGFPIVAAHSDLLEKSASYNLTLPSTWIKNTLKCRVQVYPSTLADLQNGLEAMLREPGGCFEQTSTSNYPNILILQYLKESDQAKPAIERRAHDLLDRGYQMLTSFECQNQAEHKREGYEWFGGTAPPHEALTAYGLMEFRDMAKVHAVDAAMMQRTREYLLQQRDGQGGFKRNPRALDTFGRAPQNITNAYIVWALTESGQNDDITKELNALHEQAKSSKDPYFISLVANSLINRAKTADAAALLKKASELQKEDGHLDAEQTSITGSGGRDLQIETTSLAVLGWLRANPGQFNAAVQKAVRWIGQQRGGYGGFGSTQSTILALKALILYTKANKKTPEAGELRLFVGDKLVGNLPFASGATEPLTLSVPNPEATLNPGKNALRIEITGKNAFPYTLSWSYQTRQPASADKCPVKLSAKIDRTEVREGETVHLNVHVENASGKGQGMAVAILGLPSGLTIPEDMKQLKDHARQPEHGLRPLVSAYEIRGRELVLYWRDLAPDQKIDVPIDLICRIPGEYSGPASRAYLYYNADLKHWIEPLAVKIAAKAE